jgi:transcriptional regulator with XRE-family HTH domain
VSDYSRVNLERHKRIVANRAELIARRDEAFAVKRPDHVDLAPPPDFVHDVTGRRELQPDPALVRLGRYLRRSRIWADKSQQRLADEAGVSQSMVSRAERGLAPSMGLERLVNVTEQLGRIFPFGVCPHDHECSWQPIKRPEREVTSLERFIEMMFGQSSDDAAPSLERNPVDRAEFLDISISDVQSS